MKQRDPGFHTTRWSVVQAAGGESSPAATQALAVLAETYWYPLYAFVRRSGHAREDAEDLTQGFFARLFEKRDVKSADPRRGKFRTYLLASLKHYMANEWDRSRALKRGGGVVPLSIDFQEADRQYRLEADERSSPDRVFERQWALAILAGAISTLRDEYAARGEEKLFGKLRPALLGDEDDRPRRDLADSLGMNAGALNVALHRMRRRFGARLRAEVVHTVADPGEVEGELRLLMDALRS